jgi:hypothetical protein
MQASRVGRGPFVLIALSVAALAAVPRESAEPAAAAPIAAVRVELRSPPPPPPPPQAEPEAPREVRCCACAMARNEELWREQQARERASKRKRR